MRSRTAKPISRVPGLMASVRSTVVRRIAFSMAVNQPVKQGSSARADPLVGHLQDPTEYLTNGGCCILELFRNKR